MRFTDFLRMTVLLSAGAASALAAVTLAGAATHGDSLIVPVVALLVTVFLPFVNQPTLWLGLPSVMVWTVAWVLALSAALAWVEFGRHHPDDDEDWTAAVPPVAEQPELLP